METLNQKGLGHVKSSVALLVLDEGEPDHFLLTHASPHHFQTFLFEIWVEEVGTIELTFVFIYY